MMIGYTMNDKTNSENLTYYYNKRKEIRNLYNNDVRINPRINDLFSRILQIRDKYDCVESISLDVVNFQIEADIDPDTNEESIEKVKSNIIKELDDYIWSNKNLIGVDSFEEVEKFQSIPKLYDDVSIGNNIKINL